MNDANFRRYMQLLKRLKPRTRARPQWWLFQRWLRKRPLNHEFLVSPIHDYLYSCGIGDAAMMQIKWPAWVEEFSRRWWDVTPYPLAHLTVRDCLKALDTMRGWTPHIDWRRMESHVSTLRQLPCYNTINARPPCHNGGQRRARIRTNDPDALTSPAGPRDGLFHVKPIDAA